MERITWEELRARSIGHGSHPSRERGHCVMEMVSWLAGLEHSDRPACTTMQLQNVMIGLNDSLDTQERQRLKRLIPIVVGTQDPDWTPKGVDQHWHMRCQVMADQLVRKALPFVLDGAGREDLSRKLRCAPLLVGVSVGEANASLDHIVKELDRQAYDLSSKVKPGDELGQDNRTVLLGARNAFRNAFGPSVGHVPWAVLETLSSTAERVSTSACLQAWREASRAERQERMREFLELALDGVVRMAEVWRQPENFGVCEITPQELVSA